MINWFDLFIAHQFVASRYFPPAAMFLTMFITARSFYPLER